MTKTTTPQSDTVSTDTNLSGPYDFTIIDHTEVIAQVSNWGERVSVDTELAHKVAAEARAKLIAARDANHYVLGPAELYEMIAIVVSEAHKIGHAEGVANANPQ